MFPGCSSKSIWSHTIPESSLRKLNPGEKGVYKIDVDSKGFDLKMRLEGYSVASGFYGFCSKHDSDFFSIIEDCSYEMSPKQNFAAAYRSICRELKAKYYTSRGILLYSRTMEKHIYKNGVLDLGYMPFISEITNKLLFNFSSARQLAKIKSMFEECIDSNKYDDLMSTVVVKTSRSSKILSWGLSSIENDFYGNVVPLRNFDKKSNIIFTSSYITEYDVFYVFSLFRNSKYYKRLSKSTTDYNKIGKIMPEFLIRHFELSFFDSLTSKLIQNDNFGNLGMRHLPGFDQPIVLNGIDGVDFKIKAIYRC